MHPVNPQSAYTISPLIREACSEGCGPNLAGGLSAELLTSPIVMDISRNRQDD